MVFWNLPEELTGDLLACWLDVKDTCRLDSAACARTERSKLVQLFQRVVIQARYKFHGVSNRADMYTMWIVRRDIAVTELVVTRTFVENALARRRYLLTNGKYVQAVLILAVYDRCEVLFEDLCLRCPSVVLLNCTTAISPTMSEYIAHSWNKLTHLMVDVNNLHSVTHAGTIKGCDIDNLFIAVEACQSLVELTVRGIPRLPSNLTRIFQVCSPNMQKISLSAPISSTDYHVIAARCPQLRELKIPPIGLDDAVLESLGTHCPLYTTLQVMYNSNVTDEGIAAVARNGALTSLCVNACANIIDNGVSYVARCCPLLESVDISGTQLTDATLVAVGQHCHKLRKLNVDRTGITHEGLYAVAAGCPLLEELCADYCDTVGTALEAIARGCPRLRVLVAMLAQIPREAALALARCCPLLDSVALYGADIGDKEITALAQGCPALTWLNVSGTSVTALGLLAVRTHCEGLEYVEIDREMLPGDEPELFFSSVVRVMVN
jgi:hypothetical protein